ncbi:MAG: GIY-YIG nuclease family protein [Thermodesulfobacteriota bacterium]
MKKGKGSSSDKGSYLLILKLERSKRVSVGRLGEIHFKKGFYVYVGSAMANLSKRMERHRQLRKKPHWHIDYLRRLAQFHSVLAISSPLRLECKIARALSRMTGWKVSGFGSSDCFCRTHLFGMMRDPLHSREFRRLVQSFRKRRF